MNAGWDEPNRRSTIGVVFCEELCPNSLIFKPKCGTVFSTLSGIVLPYLSFLKGGSAMVAKLKAAAVLVSKVSKATNAIATLLNVLSTL